MTNQKFPAFLAPTPNEWADIVSFTKGASTTADAMQAAMMAWNLCVEKHYEWCQKETALVEAAKKSNNVRFPLHKRDGRYSFQAVLRELDVSQNELAELLGVATTSTYKWLHSNKIPAKYSDQVEALVRKKLGLTDAK